MYFLQTEKNEIMNQEIDKEETDKAQLIFKHSGNCAQFNSMYLAVLAKIM